ncbi:hypothetical protein HMPREF0494_1526 [Limosilactobacillus antri DSM 16041]|uniref:Uncharacterized protein n=1 Tax=Limosilactobacillus antri DSM 16041 TaxID=525309 RepID=C8P882_9LACO|nr:hypothetical protein HMPREF0494_1526 [Limosilactobacillus antri DSM 16041]
MFNLNFTICLDDKYNFTYNERWIGLIDRQVLFVETVNDY